MVLAPQTSSLPKLLLKPGRWTVGSAATCSYRIIGDGVCPRHALVLCGGQSAVLKAWDSRTWHNGEQVRGEVRLQQGDRVTLGSVEFSVEPEDMLEAETLSPEVRHETSTRSAEINSAVSHSAKPDPEGWDLERLRDQIQELRDELSQRANRRIGAVAPATIPTPASEDAVKQAVKQAVEEAVNQTSARIAELERSAAEAQVIAEQVRQQHAAALADQTRREAELQQVIATLRPLLESSQFAATELRRERDQLQTDGARREQIGQQEASQLRGEWDQLRSETTQREQAWQQELADLRREREQLQSETAGREQAWQQEAVEWSAERDAWHEELISLASARQQAATEWEHRQSALLHDATHWKTECEQLRTGWQFQQATWDQERSRLEGELRQREEAVQQTLQAVTQRGEELPEQNRQLLAERQQLDEQRQQFDEGRQQLEDERQQLASESQEREPAVAALAEDRRRVELDAADVLAKFENLTQQSTEFEQQQANLSREKQALEHSWTWLQSDRRKLVDEKEQWQRERALWQADCERRDTDIEQFHREREEFAKLREGWQNQHSAEQQQLQIEQSATDVQLGAELQANINSETNDTRMSVSSSLLNSAAAESSLTSFTDEWSIGVDLTAPRETHSPTSTSSEVVSNWMTSPRTDAIPQEPSPEELVPSEAEAPTSAWVASLPPRETTDVVNATANAGTQPLSDEWGTLPTVPPESLQDSDRQEDLEATTFDDQLADEAIDESPEGSPEIDATTDNEVKPSDEKSESVPPPKDGQVVSILQSMAFAEDEDIDDSVSRYMQHLLARTQNPEDRDTNSHAPAPATKTFASVTPAVSQSPKPGSAAPGNVPIPAAVGSQVPLAAAQPSLEHSSENEASPLNLDPVHRQDKDAVRATTEHLRQVANQQTVKHVEAANWKVIKRSILTKLVLAAISFTMSAGLLFWGYYYRPDFLILGICASGLGIMTWLDLILAIRQARKRTARLAGSKPKTGRAAKS